MDSFTRKYNKNQKLARKKGPLVDRVRLGYRWDNDSFLILDMDYNQELIIIRKQKSSKVKL